jgi:hypothetical protein
VLGTIWEALSPDACLNPYETDFKWLTQVYESVKPVSGNGRLLWHRLGAKTIDLINQNVHVEAVRDDIDALVLDADVLDGILKEANPGKKAHEVEIKLIARLRKHAGNPKFKELGERLEKIREKHEQGLLNSLEFLKAILEIAKDTVKAEKQTSPKEEQDQALAALTELFNEVKSKRTHVIVERIVADIDVIVKQVRFDGWQTTAQGEREVKQALRRALLKYKPTRIKSSSTRLTVISGSIIDAVAQTFPTAWFEWATNTSASAPAEAWGDALENGFHHVDVVGDAQLIGDREQNRVGFGEGFIFSELFDEDVGFGGVTAPKNRPRRGVEKTNLIRLLLVAPKVGAITIVH